MDRYHIITGVVSDNKEVDPICHRCCRKANYVVEILPNREWVCPSCLTAKEVHLMTIEVEGRI